MRAATAPPVFLLLGDRRRGGAFSPARPRLAGRSGASRRRPEDSSAGPAFRFRTSRPSLVLSRCVSELSEVPRSPNAVSIARASRVVVPSGIATPARYAVPSFPAGSAIVPARAASVTATFGRSRRSTTRTSSPLESFADLTSGARNGWSLTEGRRLRAVERRTRKLGRTSPGESAPAAGCRCRASAPPPCARLPRSRCVAGAVEVELPGVSEEGVVLVQESALPPNPPMRSSPVTNLNSYLVCARASSAAVGPSSRASRSRRSRFSRPPRKRRSRAGRGDDGVEAGDLHGLLERGNVACRVAGRTRGPSGAATTGRRSG